MTKHQSLTTPDIQHDEANMLAELILLNRNAAAPPFPWRSEHRKLWGSTVAAIKKIMRQHKITADQIAFYIYRCNPIEINGEEFAKMAVVAKKLFRKHDLADLVSMYKNRREKIIDTGGIENAGYTTSTARKSLADFLKELENE